MILHLRIYKSRESLRGELEWLSLQTIEHEYCLDTTPPTHQDFNDTHNQHEQQQGSMAHGEVRPSLQNRRSTNAGADGA